MALELTGKIVQKMNKTEGISKAGKPWSKQEFVIETQETYPKKVMISTMNEKTNDLERYNVGDTITASLNLESREYNGRWYTDARAWKIQGSGAPAQATASADPFHPDNEPSFTTDSSTDDLPF